MQWNKSGTNSPFIFWMLHHQRTTPSFSIENIVQYPSEAWKQPLSVEISAGIPPGHVMIFVCSLVQNKCSQKMKRITKSVCKCKTYCVRMYRSQSLLSFCTAAVFALDLLTFCFTKSSVWLVCISLYVLNTRSIRLPFWNTYTTCTNSITEP